jgi:S-adenosylmethionine synthetase
MWPRGKVVSFREKGFMSHSLFSSESVCSGHPDKLCDRISDSILDAVLDNDPEARVAVETLATQGHLFIAGEVTTHTHVDYAAIAREEIRRLGYTDPELKFTDASPVEVFIHKQSPDIAQGVVKKKGAGDQGMMFGYACRESDSYMPLPIVLAHSLARELDEARENSRLPYLRPDGKTQVTVQYENGEPVSVQTVVMAVPHSPAVELEEVRTDMYAKIVSPVLEKYGYSVPANRLIVNGTGVWHFSGPAADTGLTGRKIVVDTYGGYARVGGGCFSGKDPSKVDRSGAYAARYLAKNLVAHQLADRAEVSLAYYIGAKQPVMKNVETFGTAKVSEKKIYDYLDRLLDVSVEGIIEGLRLRRPIYRDTAAYGHFGRPEFPWEDIAAV